MINQLWQSVGFEVDNGHKTEMNGTWFWFWFWTLETVNADLDSCKSNYIAVL